MAETKFTKAPNAVESRLNETYPWSFEELMAQLAQEQIEQEFLCHTRLTISTSRPATA